MQLPGATVIVTGASHGIGRAASLRLAERGAHVVAVGRDEAALDEVARLTGGTAVVSDVTDTDHVDTVVRRATTATGRMDAVVLNAGIGWAGEFVDMPPERIGALLEVNVRAPMLLAREVLPRLVEQRQGSLVFVTSVAGLVPVPQEAVYSATKSALEFFAEALWHEVRGSGVSVSTVSPGVVRTDFFDVRGQPYDRSFPRLIPPERIAAAIVTAIERGSPSITAPRWLGYPARLRGAAPGLYRVLSRLGV